MNKINFIGDSHSVLTFGQTIVRAFEEQNLATHFLAFSGLKLQYLSHWSQHPEPLTIANFEKKPNQVAVFSKEPQKLGGSFKINDADILIIALGTNDLVEVSASNVDIFPRIDLELKKLTVKKIVFIEPPILPRFETASPSDIIGLSGVSLIRKRLIEHLKALGLVVVSCGEYKADQNDGIHMKKEMALSYGKFIAEKLLELILPHH